MERTDRPKMHILTDQNGQVVGYFISKPALLHPRDLDSLVRHQLTGDKSIEIRLHADNEPEPTRLSSDQVETLREGCKKGRDIQEAVVRDIRDIARQFDGLTVMTAEPTS